MFCVYCNRHGNHGSLQHKCKNCDKTGHTTGYCKEVKKDVWYSDRIFKRHECVKKTGDVCRACEEYVKKTYLYEPWHMFMLQEDLKLTLSIYGKYGEIDITEADIPKLTKKQLVKYINILYKIMWRHYDDEAKRPPKERKYKSYEDLVDDQCEACEGDCTGCGICGTCRNGHCVCNALYYLRGKCIAMVMSSSHSNETSVTSQSQSAIQA